MKISKFKGGDMDTLSYEMHEKIRKEFKDFKFFDTTNKTAQEISDRANAIWKVRTKEETWSLFGKPIVGEMEVIEEVNKVIKEIEGIKAEKEKKEREKIAEEKSKRLEKERVAALTPAQREKEYRNKKAMKDASGRVNASFNALFSGKTPENLMGLASKMNDPEIIKKINNFNGKHLLSVGDENFSVPERLKQFKEKYSKKDDPENEDFKKDLNELLEIFSLDFNKFVDMLSDILKMFGAGGETADDEYNESGKGDEAGKVEGDGDSGGDEAGKGDEVGNGKGDSDGDEVGNTKGDEDNSSLISFEAKFENLFDALFDYGDFSENQTILSVFNKKLSEDKDGKGQEIKNLIRQYNKSSIDIIANIQNIIGLDNDQGELITDTLGQLFDKYLNIDDVDEKRFTRYYRKIKKSDKDFDSHLKDFIKQFGLVSKDVDSFIGDYWRENFNEGEDINCGIEDELNDLDDAWEKYKPLLRSRVCCYKRYIVARNIFWGTCADIMTGQNILSKKLLMHGKKIIGAGIQIGDKEVKIADLNRVVREFLDDKNNKKLEKYIIEIKSIVRAKIKLNKARVDYNTCMGNPIDIDDK